MTMAITVRRLQLGDYAAIVEVLRICGMNPRVKGRDSRANFARQIRSRQTVYQGAFDGPRLVGTVFGTHDTRKGWINRLAVLPEYQHRGIATRLVRAAERALRARGLSMFAALIDDDNVASQTLFSKLGYEKRNVLYYSWKLRDEI